MKTLLQFRVKKSNGLYIRGYEEASKYFLGFCNDSEDDSLLGVAFDEGEPDTYFEIERVN